MKNGNMRENAALPGAQAYTILHTGLMYIIYGLKGTFDVYVLAGASDGVYKCVTQFGEEITIQASDGCWIDVEAGVQTNKSRSLGTAIDNKLRPEIYFTA